MNICRPKRSFFATRTDGECFVYETRGRATATETIQQVFVSLYGALSMVRRCVAERIESSDWYASCFVGGQARCYSQPLRAHQSRLRG